VIVGDIRHGRDVATAKSCCALSLRCGRHHRPTEAELIVGLRETPSENAMEAGLIFPAPGQEEAWLKPIANA